MRLRRLPRLLTTTAIAALLPASTALACGFLVAENGAIRLDTFTAASILTADGDAHYVTAFTFSGIPEDFGAIIPLPDVPTTVEKAPGWFLQRLLRETSPFPESRDAVAVSSADGGANVIATYEVDALDITILEGGGQDVLDWAADNGFDLGVRDGDIDDQSDAVSMLEFYAERSTIFAAVKFDNQRAVDQEIRSGEGIPVHFAFADQRQAWIPVKVLGFDKGPTDLVVADLFLMTPGRPKILGGNVPGTEVTFQQAYGPDSELVADLRDDERAEWIPTDFTLTRIDVRTETSLVDWDVAAAVDQRPGAGWAFGQSWVDRLSGVSYDGPAPHSANPQIVRSELGEDRSSAVGWIALALAAAGAVAWRRRRAATPMG